jgi:Protein of unknown function (DUF1552)
MTHRLPPDPSRRRLLKAAGLVAASSPLLSVRRLAYAQAGVTPLRLVCWPMMNGADANKFYPSNMGAMSVISAPIQAYSKYATFIRSINVSGSVNHYAVRSIYSGFPVANYESADPNVKSVDQLIADQIARTAPTPLKSLHLGVIPADSINYYKRAGRSTFFFAPTPVDYEANPVTAFDRVFAGAGGAPAPGPAPGAPDFTADSLNLLDQEMNELGGRLAAIPSELAKLNQHKEALKTLRPSPVSTMPRPMMPSNGTTGGNTLASVEKLRPMLQGNAKDAYKHAYFSDIFDAQVDIMARALVTGHTRVATIQAGSADGNAVVPVDRGFPHHNTSHGNQEIFSRCQAWYFTKMARLLQALDVPDPLDAGKTVLHNTVLVLIAECLPVGHGSNGVPTLLVGGGGGQIKGMGNILSGGGNNKQVMATVLRMFNTDPAHFGSGTIAGVL